MNVISHFFRPLSDLFLIQIKGLGNKFLNDLRAAHVLLHIVDVSGRTNEKGEETQGYDPLNDIEWLQDEIFNWIFNNIYTRWGSIVRRHVGTSNSNTFR